MWLADPGSPAGRTAGCGWGESGPLWEPGVTCGSPAPHLMSFTFLSWKKTSLEQRSPKFLTVPPGRALGVSQGKPE